MAKSAGSTDFHANRFTQNQIYFWILQRKALTPNDFDQMRLVIGKVDSAKHYQRVATPFQWKFTRSDLRRLLSKLQTHEDVLAPAA